MGGAEHIKRRMDMVRKIYGPRPNLNLGGKAKPVTVSKANVDKLCAAIQLDQAINGVSVEEGWERPAKSHYGIINGPIKLEAVEEEPIQTSADPLAERLRKFINGHL